MPETIPLRSGLFIRQPSQSGVMRPLPTSLLRQLGQVITGRPGSGGTGGCMDR